MGNKINSTPKLTKRQLLLRKRRHIQNVRSKKKCVERIKAKQLSLDSGDNGTMLENSEEIDVKPWSEETNSAEQSQNLRVNETMTVHPLEKIEWKRWSEETNAAEQSQNLCVNDTMTVHPLEKIEWKQSPDQWTTMESFLDSGKNETMSVKSLEGPTMSTEDWNIERRLCRCCHSEGTFKSLSSISSMETDGTYTEILADTLDIKLCEVSELLSAATYSICEVCIARLRDAHSFKSQVLKCETHFQNMYKNNCIKVAHAETEVKEELQDCDVAENIIGDDCLDSALIAEVKAKRKKATPKRPGVRKRRRVIKDIPASEECGKSVTIRKVSFKLSPSDYERDGDIFKCVRCQKTCNDKSGLKYHVRATHEKLPAKYYTCTLCNQTFHSLAKIIEHKLTEHSIDDRVKCNACDNLFNTKHTLRQHQDTYHKLGLKHSCPHCDFECIGKAAMTRHKIKHKTVKENHCRYCKKSFLRKTTLRFHERIHTGDRRKVCKECGQAFVQKASLNYHMEADFGSINGDDFPGLTHNKKAKSKKMKQKGTTAKKQNGTKKVSSEKPCKRVLKRAYKFGASDYERVGNTLKCLRCKKIYKSMRGLSYHIRSIHLDLVKHTCNICNKTYLTIPQLKNHKLTEHAIDERIKCNACERSFNRQQQYVKHMLSFHMLGDKFSCQHCDYECYNKRQMNQHLLNHKSEKDYHCKYCKKSFKTQRNLNLHERIHTGDRRKVCKECGQAFVQKASLNYHMGKYHPGVKF